MAKKRKPKESALHGFKLGLLIYTVVLFVIFSIALCVLTAFLRSYEKNLPEKVAQSYLDSLKENGGTGIYNLTSDILLENDEKTEPRNLILARCGINNENLRVTKYVKEYTHDAPVYRIISGEWAIGRIILKKSDKNASFGLTAYEIDEVILDVKSVLESAKRSTYTVIVPCGTMLSVNGNEVGNEYLTSEGESYKGRAFLPVPELCNVYSFELYTVPDITAKNEKELKLRPDGNTCDWFTEGENSFTMTVPAEASVSIMGSLPDVSFAKTTKYVGELTEFEQSKEKLPAMLTYTVYGNKNCEKTVTLRGEALTETHGDGKSLIYDFTDESKYSVFVTVLENATLFLNGIEVSDDYRTLNAKFESLSEVPEISDAYGEGACYKVSGLLSVPTVTAKIDGKELHMSYMSQKVSEINCEFLGSSSESLENENKSVAEGFAKAYIHYVANGAEGLEKNVSALLALIKNGSSAQKKITRSKESFAFVNKSTYTVKNLMAHDFIPLASGAFFCSVDFDVTMRSFHNEKPYCGTFSLICTSKGLISCFAIDTADEKN